MAYFLKIFKQSSWQILGKAVTSLSTFIILGIVARNYGQSGTGVFTLALTYLAIFYLLADFGFNAHVLRSISRSESQGISNEWQKLLGTRILWSGLLVVLAVGLLPFWPFANTEFDLAVLIGSLAIIFSGIFTTCNLIFQDKLRYDLSVLASSGGTILSLAVFIFLSTIKSAASLLLFAHLFGWIIMAFLALILIRKFLPRVIPLFDISYAKKLFKQSWPIAITLALNVLYFRADSFMIAYFKGVSDAGVYNVAYSVFQSILVLPTFIMNSYYPLMLKSLSKVKYVGLGLLGLSVFGALLTLVSAPVLIKVLTGGGFAGSVKSLQILSLGFPAFFVSSLLMWVFVTKGKYKLMLLLYTSGLVFNIALNYIFIPRFSFLAASWITVISEYLILMMQVIVLLWGKTKGELQSPVLDKEE